MIAIANKKTANQEQEKAIFHKGGKLLSAGAGSGKTFVLIEHLIFLLKNIKEDFSSEEWNKKISFELSKIVLMTFTKKAAGEISVRMMKKIEELLVEAELLDNKLEWQFWIIVRKNLSFLNITTIHGFCHQLLGLGAWNEFPQDIQLVSSIEHKNKIQKLFDSWFKKNQAKLAPVFLSSTGALMSAMMSIFTSPELRVMWSELNSLKNANEEIDNFFTLFLELKGHQNFFKTSIDLQVSAKEEKKKWFELLAGFNEVLLENGKITADNFLRYSHFFKSISRFPVTNSKEISQSQREVLAQIRELREDLKEIVDDLTHLKDDFATYQSWVLVIGDLFSFIESQYFTVDGFSFSDLEYYAFKALKNPEVLAKIQENYHYFIIDEFQDTSFIQFDILKSLIGKSPEKLFCVGDRKQAIYGFRGGELQVFSDCSILLGESNNYFLKNNFRSSCDIIKFNNAFFEKVFPLGFSYEGHDPHGVQMELQNIPQSTQEIGKVVKIRAQIVGNTKEIDLDLMEAHVLCDQIENLLTREDIDSVCILYRKLKPSAILLDLFLEKGIEFSAQIKMQFSNDPLVNILLYLIELQLNNEDLKKIRATHFLLHTLLDVLEVSNYHASFTDQFSLDLKLLGLRLAFHKFIFSLGLSNSLYAQNAEVIDAICRLTKEDITKVYHLLKNDEGEEYHFDMMSGSSAVGSKQKRVIIMSAHASKGLEFDAVLLGGVHTNGRYNGMKELIGKFPHSFKWKKSFDQKKLMKSPAYYLESETLKLKDFSESKRLLYVACTRAVKFLGFVDLWSVVKEEDKDLYLYDNSWIQALRLAELTDHALTIDNIIKKRIEIPLIQKDPLGIFLRNNQSSLGLLSELSVTRLATIADCPFKFYLQNICKIEVDKNLSSLFIEESENEEGESFYSSKKKRDRGAQVFVSIVFK